MSDHRNNIDDIWEKFIRKGDEVSFSEIYNLYVDRLYSYGIHLGFNDDLCRDAVQDVFCRLYSSRQKLSEVTNPAAYLFKSLKFRLIDLIRKKSKMDCVEIRNDSFSIDVTVLDNIIDKETFQLIKNKIDNLLNSLTPQQREIIYLRYMAEMDYSEISQLLGINSDSARKNVFRALEKMRSQVSDKITIGQLIFFTSALGEF
jgi:RNA polymerase sigma factor (sigma-70 family)